MIKLGVIWSDSSEISRLARRPSRLTIRAAPDDHFTNTSNLPVTTIFTPQPALDPAILLNLNHLLNFACPSPDQAVLCHNPNLLRQCG